jgi:Tfp pilus assembly protein PilF
MNVNLRRGSTLLIAALLISGCSATSKANLDSQADLNSALRQAELGNTASAKTWVDNAIKADPNDVNLYAGDTDSGQQGASIADIFGYVNDSASQAYYMRKATAQFPNDYHAWEVLVDDEQLMGDKVNLQKDATTLVSVLQAAILQSKNNKIVPRLTEYLADAYCLSGNAVMGVQKYKSLIASDPNNPGPLNDLAYHYADVNDKPHLNEALADANNAIKAAKSVTTTTDVETANYLDTLAWVQYRLGDLADAEQNAQIAVNDSPDVPEMRYHLATIYQALGQIDEAKVEVNHALVINSAYADAIALSTALNGAPPAAVVAKTDIVTGTKPTTQAQ